jgi:hypothetical protein
MNKTILTLLLIIVLAGAVCAKSSLDLGIAGVGARPMGMGRSFVAVADDVNALFLNPAGMAFQDSWALTSMSTKLLNRVDYKLIGGIYPTDQGTFGIGYVTLATPAGYATTDLASLASATPISYGSSMLILSYAYDLGQQIEGNTPGDLAFGGNLKLLSSQFEGVDNANASGMEVDLAVLYKASDAVTLGANLQNTLFSSDDGGFKWSSGTTEDIPSVLKLGVAYHVKQDLLVSLDSDINIGNDQPALLHTGIEWSPTSIITLRTGIDQDTSSTYNLTAGTSIKINGVSFEYAYRHDGSQGDLSNHYFSLSFSPANRTRLVAKPKKEKEKVAVEATKLMQKEEEKAAPASVSVIETKRSNGELSYNELIKELYGSK